MTALCALDGQLQECTVAWLCLIHACVLLFSVNVFVTLKFRRQLESKEEGCSMRGPLLLFQTDLTDPVSYADKSESIQL